MNVVKYSVPSLWNLESWLNSFFGENTTPENSWVPMVNISEDENGYLVKVDLPGVDEKDIKVTLENNLLNISGERKEEKEKKGNRFYLIERTFGSFSRSFTMPKDVDGKKVKVTFKQGVLTLALPKEEKSKPKSLKIEME